MVRTPRHRPAPPGLVRRQNRWTTRWKEIIEGKKKGDWATKSAKDLLRRALHPITHGKCAYCESKLGASSYPQIDHYTPKTVDPKRAFEWSNLFPVCQICNTSKGEKNHGGLLLKPDEVDPETYFWIDPDSGELQLRDGLAQDERRCGDETIALCNLQRGALCANRLEMTERVRRWLQQASKYKRRLPKELREEWASLVQPTTEFKLVVRHELEKLNAQELAQEDRRRFEAAPVE